MASISPVCKKFKHFILALKSPTYRDFMIKKPLKSKTSKSHTWAPLSLDRKTVYIQYACLLHREKKDLERGKESSLIAGGGVGGGERTVKARVPPLWSVWWYNWFFLFGFHPLSQARDTLFHL
jgi:hypothetical protein